MDIPGRIGEQHREAVLRLLRDGRPRTRAQLARELGLARSTISEVLTCLIDEGGVVPRRASSPLPAGRGRPPEVLTLDPDAGHHIGLDFSHHHVVAVVVNATREIIATDEAGYTLPDSWPQRLRTAIALIDALAERSTVHFRSLQGVAVGLPGPNSIAWGAPGSTLSGVDTEFRRIGGAIAVELTDRFAVPTLVDHHVRFAALAESAWGRAEPLDNLLYLRLSKGVGGAFLSAGTPARGAHSVAGELGHVVVDASANARPCRCGRRGCLETLASIDGVLETAAERGGHYAGLDELAAARGRGESPAETAVDTLVQHVGRVLGTAALVIDPAEIVLAGECTGLAPDFCERVSAVVADHTLPSGPHPHCRLSALGPQAGAIGAALAASRVHQIREPETSPASPHARREDSVHDR